MNLECVVHDRGGLGCLYAGSFPVVSGQSSRLCPYLIRHWVLPGVPTHLSAKMDSSTKVSGRLAGHYGPALPPSFRPSPRLRTPSVHVSDWEILLTTRMKKLWSLCLSPNPGPVLQLVSYLEVSAGDQLQLLSLRPIHLLPHFLSCLHTHSSTPSVHRAAWRCTSAPSPAHTHTPCYHCPSRECCASRKLPNLQSLMYL